MVMYGTVTNGVVVPDQPLPLAAGERVVVRPADEKPVGLSDDGWDDSPEGIAAWVAWADALEPLGLSPEQEEQIRQARADQRAFELATWDARATKIEKLFQ